MRSMRQCAGLYAMQLLLPTFARAAEVAHRIQADLLAGKIQNPYGKDDESRFSAALTPADLLVEDIIGAEVYRLFSDVSFMGEEHALDRVSNLFPRDADYVLTLDPINGTLYYMHGVPQWDMIVSLRYRDEYVAGMIYLPHKGLAYAAERDDGAYCLLLNQEIRNPLPFRLHDWGSTVQVNTGNRKTLEGLRKARYHVVNSRTDYRDGDRDWKYATHGILTGSLCGILKENTNMIDSGVIAFIAEEAGATVTPTRFDPMTGRGGTTIIGATPEIHDAIVQAIA